MFEAACTLQQKLAKRSSTNGKRLSHAQTWSPARVGEAAHDATDKRDAGSFRDTVAAAEGENVCQLYARVLDGGVDLAARLRPRRSQQVTPQGPINAGVNPL